MKRISNMLLLLMISSATSAAPHRLFITKEFGTQKPSSLSSTTVNNGSGLAAPNNLDIYTVNGSDRSGVFGLQTGLRWELMNKALTAVSLGLQYQHFFRSNLHGQVIEFSLPEFTNYDYFWQNNANLLLANAKFNFVEIKKISPFFNFALGGVIHKGHYSEKAIGGVTPRTWPNFGKESSAQFAYILGAGLDYRMNDHWIGSASYQYTALGKQRTGLGQQTWASQKLDFGRYHSNALLASLTYLFDATN